MPRKKPAHVEAPQRKRTGFPVYCEPGEPERFTEAAKRDGLGDRGRNKWLLQLARKRADELLGPSAE